MNYYKDEQNVPLDWNVNDTILDLYEILPVNEAGDASHKGGFGKVYKVHHKTWNVDLAVKAPHAHKFQTEQEKQNFINECQAWIELGLHPNIASCYYVRELGRVPRIFAEYVEGGSLKDWIESGRLYEGSQQDALLRILDIAIQFAWGLHYAHEKGLIHQDIKPGNVMMTPDGEAKVTDFGLARAKATGGVGNTGDGQTMMMDHAGACTPEYYSPEQYRGAKLTRRTDLWSWAVSVLEMFVGGRSWRDGAVAGDAFSGYLQDSRIKAPKGLFVLLQKCFYVTEAKRPHTMKMVADAVIQIYENESGESYFREWQDGPKDTADELNNRALSYLDMGDEAKALSLWEQAISMDTHHLASTYNMGLVLWRRGEITDLNIIERLEYIHQSHTHNWKYFYFVAMVHMERSDAEMAKKALNEAQKLYLIDNEDIGSALKTVESKEGSWSGIIKYLTTNEYGTCGWSSDGKLALRQKRPFSNIFLLDTNTKKERIISQKKGIIECAAISASGKYGAFSSDHGFVEIWSLETGQRLKSFKGYKDRSQPHIVYEELLLLGIDDMSVFVSEDNKLTKWDIQGDARTQMTFELGSDVQAAVFSADMRIIVLAAGDEKNRSIVKLWNTQTGELLCAIGGCEDIIKSVAISEDKSTLAISGEVNYKWIVNIYETDTGKCISTFEDENICAKNIVLSRDGRYAFYSNGSNTFRQRDVKSGQCLRSTARKKETISDIKALSNDSSVIITAGKSRFLWRIGENRVKANNFYCEPEDSKEEIRRRIQFEEKIRLSKAAVNDSRYKDAFTLLTINELSPKYKRRKEVVEQLTCLYRYLPKKAVLNHHSLYRKRLPLKISSFFVNSDGDLIVAQSNSYDNTTLYNILTDTYIGELEGKVVSRSVDGELFISHCRRNIVRVWDTINQRCLQSFIGHTDKITAVRLSYDKKFAVSGSRDSLIKLWDVKTGECLRTFTGHIETVTSLDISADNMLIISGSNDKAVRLWSIESGKCIFRYDDDEYKIKKVGFSADGSYVFAFGDNKLRFWDVETGQSVRPFNGRLERFSPEYCVSSTDFIVLEDNNIAVTTSEDKTIRLWSNKSLKCIYELDTEEDYNHLVSSRDGRYIAAISYSTIEVFEITWEMDVSGNIDEVKPYLQSFLRRHISLFGDDKFGESKKPIWTEGDFQNLIDEIGYRGYGWINRDKIKALLKEMIESDQYRLKQKSFRISSSPKQQLRRFIDEARISNNRLRYSKARWALYAKSKLEENDRNEHMYKIMAALRFTLPKRELIEMRETHTYYVKRHTKASISDDGSFIVYSDDDYASLKIIDVNSRKTLRTYVTAGLDIIRAKMSGDGFYTACLWGTGKLSIWSNVDGGCVFSSAGQKLIEPCFSADGRMVLYGRDERSIDVVCTRTGESIKTIESDLDHISEIALSNDSRFVALGHKRGSIELFDLVNGRKEQEWRGLDYVRSIAISSDLRVVVSISGDIKVWDIETGKCINTFEREKRNVSVVVISPDNRYILCGNMDGEIKVWDIDDCYHVKTFKCHKCRITSLDITADGRYMVSGSADKTVKLWELNWDIEERDQTDWDDGAKPYLKNFLRLHQPFKMDNPLDREGTPVWMEDEFNQFLVELGYRGYGWLRAEGVRTKLIEMRDNGEY